jgi:hypothetical protein
MFHRKKPDSGNEPNRLRIEAEPNTLSWGTDDATDTLDEDFVADEDLDEDLDEDASDIDDPEAQARRAAELQAELEREAEEYGLTGDNTTLMYGPNGEAVQSLILSLPTIDYDTAEAIADEYEAVPEAERKVAQTDIRRRHRGGDLEVELRAAEQAVADWLASLMLGDDDEALFRVVAAAATDAVDALVLEDELDDVDFATLYGPWSEVMDTEDDDEAEPGDGSAGVAASPAAQDTEQDEASADEESADEASADEGEFGPNTDLVVEFLTTLSALDSVKTAELVAAWRAQPKEELRVAHRSLQSLADEDAKWREQLRLAQEEIFAWMDHRTTRLLERYTGTGDAQLRESAGPAMADAVAALVMADMLEPEDAARLYAPWAETVGEPALPAYEDDEK